MASREKPLLEILEDEVAWSGDFVEAVKRFYKDRNGNRRVWEFMRRKQQLGVAIIAAVTDEHELILERTFRIPLNADVIELPAGLYEPDKETTEDAIRRELLEETGFTVDRVEPLFDIVSNQGLLGDGMSFYLGYGAKRIKAPELEPTEDIETVLVPLRELSPYLLKEYRNGAKIDLKTLAVLPLLQERGFSL